MISICVSSRIFLSIVKNVLLLPQPSSLDLERFGPRRPIKSNLLVICANVSTN